ncbi:hypothetical protein Tco_0173589 [Tanacetum coccineum]
MRQRRWLDLLKDYDCEIRYHPGKANVVADALSQKETEKVIRIHSLHDSQGIKTPQGRIYIPFWSNVKELLLEEAYKSKYSIRPGATKMSRPNIKIRMAFNSLQKKLCESPILVLPEGTEDMVVYRDASYSSLGCKANVVVDALSRKEREKVTRIHSLQIIVTSDTFDRIKAAQVEALIEKNWKSERITSYIPHLEDDSRGD